MITKEELEALNKSKLLKDAPFFYHHISETQLSIARRYGGCNIGGYGYRYILPDTLIRRDVERWLEQYRTKERRKKKEAAKQAQGKLF